MIRKAISTKMLAENHVEINFYGEIIESRPFDWWSGEPVKGLFITLEDFLENLDELKAADEITMRINSPGGDVSVAQSIYSQIKSLNKNVTAIIDGVAASAATILAMAANKIMIHAGGRFMIHKAMTGVCGWLTEEDLNLVLEQNINATRSAAETYHNKTKIPTEEIMELMKATTWYTGREAVDAKFCDELIYEDKDPDIAMSADKKYLIVNNVKHRASLFTNFPQDIPVKQSFLSSIIRPNKDNQEANDPSSSLTGRKFIDKNIEPKTGGKKIMQNVEELKKEYPELCSQLQKESINSGITQERQRIQKIEEIASQIGDSKLVDQAKFGENPMTAEQMAHEALKKNQASGQQFLENLKEDSANTSEIGGTPNGGASLTEEEIEINKAKSIAAIANKDK